MTFLVLLVTSCDRADHNVPDRLNERSYSFRYVNIDSCLHYANLAYNQSYDYSDGRAEALNNMAFVAYQQMCYSNAMSLLESEDSVTGNQVELMCADVMKMKIAQRTCNLRAFYRSWHIAQMRLARIEEEEMHLDEHQIRRVLYARTEMHIIAATYYYYNRQDSAARAEMSFVRPEILIPQDTAQWTNYLYMMGSGGMLIGDTQDIVRDEYGYLMQADRIAQKRHDIYFEANAKQALALLIDDSLLLENSLDRFLQYGDLFQTANVLRSISEQKFNRQDYSGSLEPLLEALDIIHEQSVADSISSPLWKARIYERLSLTYSALGDKQSADYYRTLYLDLVDSMRQDLEEEARADELDQYNKVVYFRLSVIAFIAIAMIIAFWRVQRRSHKRSFRRKQTVDDEIQSLKEETSMLRLQLEKERLSNIERRAKVSLAESVVPLIVRMLNSSDISYIRELAEKIQRTSDTLTQWIQIRRGYVVMNITTFPLQEILDTISRNRITYTKQGIELNICDTDVVVKADKALTLFMINTLCDNARKFTPAGGSITVSVVANETYAEISVIDTGCGLSAENVDKINNSKVFKLEISNDNAPSEDGHGFGFGLMNCKGIIGSMKKMSSRFDCCDFGVESAIDKGSRFWIRLPRVLKVLVLLVLIPYAAYSQPLTENENATELCDSIKKYNILQDYSEAYRWGVVSLDVVPADSIRLRMDIENEMAIASQGMHRWDLYRIHNQACLKYHRQLTADPNLPLYAQRLNDLQSESDWALVFTCILVLFSAISFVMIVRKSRRQRNDWNMQNSFLDERKEEMNRVRYELDRLHIQNQILDNSLSTIKHETMYYPSRILRMTELDDTEKSDVSQLVEYYKEIYTILLEQAERWTAKPCVIDELMLKELKKRLISAVDQIAQGKAYTSRAIVETDSKDKILTVRISFDGVDIPENLFTPEAGNLDAFVAREIVRKHDALCGYPGLRLYVENNIITITLWNNSKLLSSRMFSWN